MDIKAYIDNYTLEQLESKYQLSHHGNHHHRVRAFSLCLFSFLKSRFALTEEQGNLLQISAHLHDLGHFINEKQHDKHTRYLINQDQLLSHLPPKLRSMLALIGGGHRNTLGKELNSHDSAERATIIKLAAILRVADALDYPRHPAADIQQIGWRKGGLTIYMINTDIAAVANRVEKKGLLFNDCFGDINVELDKGKG